MQDRADAYEQRALNALERGSPDEAQVYATLALAAATDTQSRVLERSR